MEKDTTQQYIYIVQASLEPSKCKIGKTNDLERRLSEYNNMTGKSKENVYAYLFACEVSNATKVENDIKQEISFLREEKSKEIYFYNPELLKKYVDFIKKHHAFVKEIIVKSDDKSQNVRIVKKETPSIKERGLTQKDLMQKAKNIDNDEFYTRYEDIEKELSMYDIEIWRDKVVFCNCDDAVGGNDKNTSAFALYFINNFKHLNLKELICTHYSGQVDLFNQGTKGYIFRKTGFSELGAKDYPRGYSGSFDDPLSVKILNEEADIVCTNPPFSRAIDYWKLLVDSGKQFIIMSNIANVVTNAFIPYFYNHQVWAGYNRVDYFLNPKRQLTDASAHWYTNIPIVDRPKYKHLKIMPLAEIPEKNKIYDDAGTLLVSDCYIPNDYDKPFAVSVRPVLNGLLEKGYNIVQTKRYTPYVDGKEKFAKVLVQKG
jgi:predicted GIY-YIG superfamily endonuclease